MNLKRLCKSLHLSRGLSKQMLLSMKFIALMLFIAVMQVSAKGYSQVSISAKNVSLRKVFTDIQRQTGYDIVCTDDVFRHAPYVNINLHNASVKAAMDACINGKMLSYEIIDKTIIVKRIPNTAKVGTDHPLIVLPALSYAISGTVQDSTGTLLSGVSVSIKGTFNGTFTNANGSFSLAVSKGDVLVFSHVGYESKEVTVKGQPTVNVLLTSMSNSLNDIVIVGYGTQQKKDVTGALASIGTKELLQSPVANLSNALAGRLPGLITIQNSGEPGADGSTLLIRGLGTTGSNAPLILVDGIQRDFSSIDPNEVSDITILKDAASTAIYGIKGANGVVLVTTRRGVNDHPSISVTGQNGWQSPTRLPKYADSYDALKLYREGLENDGLSTTQYSDSILNLYKDRSKPVYQYLYPNVDWLQEMLKPYSYMSQGNMNVTGGSNFAKYFISMSYLRQNGLYNFEDQIKQYDMQAVTNKYNFRSNIDLQVSKDLSMELNLGAIVRDRNYPGTSAQTLFSNMQQMPSWYMPLVNPDGSIPGYPSVTSPYDQLVNSGYQRLFETTLQSTAGFKWDMHYFLKGLSSRVRLSFDNINYRNVVRSLSGSAYQYTLKPGILADTVADLAADGVYQTIRQGNGTLDYQVTANGSRRTTLELYLNYDRNFGKHSVHAVMVYNQSSFFDAIASGQANAIFGLPYKYDGLVGRVSYNYDDRYLLELNAGYNGSEQFAPGHRLGFFPAISAGWIISRERFVKDNSALKFIDNLKLRGSFGVVGNDQLGSNNPRFLYLSTWTISDGGWTFGQNYDGNSYSGAHEVATGNPAVTWEKSKNADIGMDLSLWKNALSVTADYFWNHRTNILLNSQLIPADIGLVNVPPTNGGIINNRGFEFSIEHRKEFGKQGYDIRFNASYAQNKIVYYAEPSYTGREWQAKTGTIINQHQGYTALGLFKSDDDIASSPDQSFFGTVKPGDIKYKDLNGDGVINSLDYGYLPGAPNPKSTLGLSFSYHYTAFDVSVFFQSGLGGSLMTVGNGIYPFARFSGVLEDVINNHWVASAPDRNYEYPRMSSQVNTNDEQSSTFWTRSGNYLRLKTVEIGYSFPDSWMKRIGIKKARIFINGINLITWDKLKIFDPEIANGGTGTYPQQKVINAGINFIF